MAINSVAVASAVLLQLQFKFQITKAAHLGLI